jgi:HlyD family secretion protein
LAANRECEDVIEELNKARRMVELVELHVPTDLPSEEYVVLEIAERSPGSAPKPGESLFKLVPANASLEAEIEIPARDIGLIKPDNVARIKLDAFPYQKHGALDGTIVTISEGAFQKGEPPTSQTLYRARVRLGSTSELKDLPPNYRLLPGMTVVSEIRVQHPRTLILVSKKGQAQRVGGARVMPGPAMRNGASRVSREGELAKGERLQRRPVGCVPLVE